MRYALLGLLLQRPGHGRDLAERLKKRVPQPTVGLSSVYAMLDGLERDGLASSTEAVGHVPSLARRHVYQATPEGADRFEWWMDAAGMDIDSAGDLRLRLLASRPCDLDRLIELTYEQEVACLDELAALSPQEEPAWLGGENFDEMLDRMYEWDALVERLAHEAEAGQIQTTIMWLGAVRATLKHARARRAGDAPDQA